MITLYGFGAGFGLPEISPFVTKTEVQLKMAGLAYRKERAMPPASPKGQLPYIVDEAESIANSTFIRAHIEGKYGFDFDAPLSLQARAQAWAFERMIEHHVYWALVGARWVDPVNFAKGPAHFFDGIAEHMREKIREDAQFRVAENYLLSGLGRHAPDEDVDLAVRSLFALSVQLGDKPYLMGDTPCGTDATAFGALAGILTPYFEFAIARADRTVRKSHGLCRPHDAAILSGVRLDAAATTGGVSVSWSSPPGAQWRTGRGDESRGKTCAAKPRQAVRTRWLARRRDPVGSYHLPKPHIRRAEPIPRWEQ